MDEFDLEMQPLGAPTADEPERAARPTPLPKPPVPTPFAPHLSARMRVVRAGGIVGMLLLAVAVVVAVTPGVRSAVAGWVHGPTPTATSLLAVGQDRFAVEDQVPWGALTIDGRPWPQIVPPRLGTNINLPQLPTFHLARGRHQLEYRADPFPPLQCSLSVPEARDDTCPSDPYSVTSLTEQGTYVRLLDLRATVDRLPVAEATRLTDAAQSALDLAADAVSATLVPGDHYVDGVGRVLTTGETLMATPSYPLERQYLSVGGPTTQGENCAGLCSTQSPFAQSSAGEWLLAGQMGITWRYADISGRMVLATGLSAPAELGDQAVTVQVGVRRVGSSWQVRLVPPIASNVQAQDLPLCALASLDLDALRFDNAQASTGPMEQWPTSSSLPALGCVFGGGATDSIGNFTGPVALVLYRCGALVTVNDAAAQVFPRLPVASAHERALALAAWPPTAGTIGPGG
jgi:hypothetical protein